VSGNEVRITGSYPDGAGYTIFRAFVFTVELGVLQGTVDWTYSLSPSGVPPVCSGTTELSGERVFEIVAMNLAGATGVPLGAEPVVTFTKDVDPVSIGPSGMRVQGPSGEVPGLFVVAGETVTFTPDPPGFAPMASYTVQVFGEDPSGVRSVAGEILYSSAAFSFTTGG
jgi:hypothetical protein